MRVCACNVHGQWSAASIDQNMNFAPSLTTVYWTLTRVFATQGGRTRFAVDGLPCPLDASTLLIKVREFLHQALKDAALSPFLKTVMDRRATHPKPILMHRFPLATCPQHIPDPVHYPAVIRAFASWSFALHFLRQMPSQPSPQRAWYSKIIDILWFFGMILVQDVSVLIGVWLLQSERDTSSFSTLFPIYG